MPGARGDASPSTLAPQALPGAGLWADLMGADDAATEGHLGLEGMPLQAPKEPSLVSRATVRLQLAPLRRLGLEGMHPPASGAPSLTAMSMCV